MSNFRTNFQGLLQVQWFDVSEEENVYVRSYQDMVDDRSVIASEVKLKKESGGRWRLKDAELRIVQTVCFYILYFREKIRFSSQRFI